MTVMSPDRIERCYAHKWAKPERINRRDMLRDGTGEKVGPTGVRSTRYCIVAWLPRGTRMNRTFVAVHPKRTFVRPICCDAQPIWRCGWVRSST